MTGGQDSGHWIGHRSGGPSPPGADAGPADAPIHAWAPTREQCIAEAVLALVESFADTSRARPSRTVPFEVAGASDEDMVAQVLDEVVYLFDTEGEIPIDAEVEDADGGLDVRLTMAVEGVQLTGPVPRTVSFDQLRFGRGKDAAGRWSCEIFVE